MTQTPQGGGAGSPAAAPARAAVLAVPECIHCGFCLTACPTYDVIGTEMDSPRGRLYLMKALDQGRIEPKAIAVRHFDLCLGCRACETDCPSGVPYAHYLEATRSKLRTSSARPLGQRLAESLALRAVALPFLAQAMGSVILAGISHLARNWPGAAKTNSMSVRSRPAAGSFTARARAAVNLLASCPVRPALLPPVTAPRGERRLRVGFLEGCVGRWVFGPVNESAARLLAGAGCEVVSPVGQGCCGALHVHSGDLEGARRLARRNIEAFERAGDLDAIVVTAAGCGSAMKEYASLFEKDPAWAERAKRFTVKVKDALEILAATGIPAPVREVRATVAYHDACHLAHAQGIRIQPRSLLAAVPGLTLVPLADSDRCCGSAGIYNLLQPETAAQILAAKLARIRESGAEIVAAANPGCLLQIAAGAREEGLNVRLVHPLEILDEATREF